MACTQGTNLRVSITRHRSDLRVYVRKLRGRRPSDAQLNQIQHHKNSIKATEAALVDHLSWCPDCKE
jgi:hypothetical protein